MKKSYKLFLLDAFALIYRAHFAFIRAPRTTSKGQNTSAIFGFTNTLLEVLEKEKPTHLAIVFDTPKPTFRHEQFEAYKAQREKQPEDITFAIPYIKKIAEAMNICLLEKDGFEADDVIGTLAKKAEQTGDFMTYMMTPDKDFGQLVSESIFIYKPAISGKPTEKHGIAEILERWQIKEVGQLVDILGLMGDAVDNIPGVPGVGEKTAQKLISEWGSLENLLENAESIKGKLGENLVKYANQGKQSKELAKIVTDVPLDFGWEMLLVEKPDPERLSPLLDELEFRTLKKRILPENNSKENDLFSHSLESKNLPLEQSISNSKKSYGSLDLFSSLEPEKLLTLSEEKPLLKLQTNRTYIHDYHIINTKELRQSLIDFLGYQDEFCFDTETTSLEVMEAKLVGLSFSYRAKEAFYVPIPENLDEAKAILNEFKPIFENPALRKIAQNLKYDFTILLNYGIHVQGETFDTMLAHYVLEPEKRHNMDILAERYLNYSPISIEELIGKKGIKQGNMREVSLEKIAEYAAEDADITFQLKEKLAVELSQQKSVFTLFKTIEMPLVEVLAEVERTGVKIDKQALAELSLVLEKDIKELQSKIFEEAGEPFNLNSPKQLGDILFDKLRLAKKPKTTKTGQYQTGEDILSKLESEHEIIRNILYYRELQKLKSTYVDALPQLISSKTGRIHTSFNQAVAATGRLSSTNPNLQNIPIRTARGREIRKAFVPTNEDFLILSADYSQIELRIMAAMAKDENMLEAFNQNLDIHTATAAKVFGLSLEDVSSDQRRKAKMINFGIIYGISAFGLAERLKISRTEAKDIIEAYFAQYPAIKKYMQTVIDSARDNGYVETFLGRRRYLPDINSRNFTDKSFAERNAVNAPIQGTAADMLKLSMIDCQRFIRENQLKSTMILTVHDELVFEVHRSETDLLSEKIPQLMANALPLGIKIDTSIGIGKNWLEAH